MTESITCMFIA